MPSWNKSGKSICLYCKRNRVPLEFWNRRCEECKKNKVKKKVDKAVTVAKRLPAAVLQRGDETIFVDKFGVPVEDHNYDLKNDPRGWKASDIIKKDKLI